MSDTCRFAFSDDLIARGRALAEGRLAFLTELYDTGRWRRYHSKKDFLVLVRESRAALDKWTALASPSQSPPAPTAARLAMPRPLPTMFGQSEPPHGELASDQLAAALAAVSLEMGLDQTELTAV